MHKTYIRVWTPVVAALGLVILLLLAGSATARVCPPEAAEIEARAATASAWSSGWTPIAAGGCQTLTHSLGADPEDYALDLLFMDAEGNLGIHRRNYGGLEWNDQWWGAYWQRLTSNTIQVCRLPNDNAAQQTHVRVWIPDTPWDYDSGWTDIDPGTAVFSHGLGITPTELLVGLWFRNPARGIHHFGFGGLTVDDPYPEFWGAYWHNLTTDAVEVTRGRDDTAVHQVRVFVTQADPPAYDSDWQAIDPGSVITLEHHLNRAPGSLVVRGECFSPTLDGPGIHRWFAGGDHGSFGGWRGTNLQNLTAHTVQAARRMDDVACPFGRVRIWVPEWRIYLPLVLNSDATEVE
jgi:hypothetical protein